MLWWLLLIRGIFAVVFGFFALMDPFTTLFSIIVVFGAFAVVDGIFAIIGGLRVRTTEPGWAWLIGEGALALLAGLVALAWPGSTAVVAAYLIAFWVLMLGVAQVATGWNLRKSGAAHFWLPVLAGLLALVAGTVLLIAPIAGATGIVWGIGYFAIVTGFLTVFAAWKVRSAVAAASGRE